MKLQQPCNAHPIEKMCLDRHQCTISPKLIKSKFHISLNMRYGGQFPNESKIIPRSPDDTSPSPLRSMGPPISPKCARQRPTSALFTSPELSKSAGQLQLLVETGSIERVIGPPTPQPPTRMKAVSPQAISNSAIAPSPSQASSLQASKSPPQSL